ncbi:MAG: hypothetical protein QM811_07355 [Pirellulales bacterium]
MARVPVAPILNRLLITLNRSFGMFLDYAMPYFAQGDERLQAAFVDFIADSKSYVRKLGEMILDHDQRVETGEFPIIFTDCFDLSAHYLLKQTIRGLERDLRVVDDCVKRLSTAADSEATTLAEEIQGNLRGHLENMRGLCKKPSPPR